MYRPNTIQSRLGSKDDDSGFLLQEVNDTLEDLQKWKEEQKRLDQELDKKIEERKMKPQELEVEEDLPIIEQHEMNRKEMKCEQADLIEINKSATPNLIVVPEIKTVNNFELFKAGNELSETLNDWNSSLDFLMAPGTHDEKQGEEWDQIKEMEKELEELEALMGSMPKLD